MNDFAISTQFIPKSGLQGLPQRLVNDGLVATPSWSKRSQRQRAPGQHRFLPGRVQPGRRARNRHRGLAGVRGPAAGPDAIQPDLDTVRIVSEKILRKHRVLPLVKRGKKLFVAISDPTNLHALDEVKFATGFSIEAIVVEEDKLSQAADAKRSSKSTPRCRNWPAKTSRWTASRSRGDDEDAAKVERSDAVDDAPIVRFINKVMLDAIKKGASDIHFEPYERSYRIRFRLDGVLKEVATPPVQLAIKMAARLKVMSRLDIAERRVPQDGRIKMKISKNRAIDFRVSTCPTLFGEKIVMRILDPSSAMLGIDSLGYEPFQKKLYMDAWRVRTA
jgi:type IV pilus assembly protein PilB